METCKGALVSTQGESLGALDTAITEACGNFASGCLRWAMALEGRLLDPEVIEPTQQNESCQKTTASGISILPLLHGQEGIIVYHRPCEEQRTGTHRS